MNTQSSRCVILAFGLASLAGCHNLGRSRTPLRASLVTDSTEVTGFHRGHGFFANIGFTFTNTTGRPISRAGCGGPGWPDLEKKVNGQWIAAYYPVVLACRTYPDFSWEPDARMHTVAPFGAYERGSNTYPQLNVDSIEGVYRLRWTFTEGTEAGAKGKRSVEAISNEFRIKLSSSPTPASNTR